MLNAEVLRQSRGGVWAAAHDFIAPTNCLGRSAGRTDNRLDLHFRQRQFQTCWAEMLAEFQAKPGGRRGARSENRMPRMLVAYGLQCPITTAQRPRLAAASPAGHVKNHTSGGRIEFDTCRPVALAGHAHQECQSSTARPALDAQRLKRGTGGPIVERRAFQRVQNGHPRRRVGQPDFVSDAIVASSKPDAEAAALQQLLAIAAHAATCPRAIMPRASAGRRRESLQYFRRARSGNCPRSSRSACL